MPIEHRPPTDTTKKQILAASGNQCAFDACSEIIVDRDHGVLVGEIAHINARKEQNGKRFDPDQSEEKNRAATNLIALCRKHHKIVDERDDIYTADRLVAMKFQHEEKVENSADRSWLRYPNGMVGLVEGLGRVQVNYWVDRSGRPQIYTDRKLAIARTAFDIYQDINRLCQLYEMVESNPEAPGKSLMQNHVKLNKSNATLDPEIQWSAIAQILCQMGEIPDVTFGEFVAYLVAGGDATSLFVNRAAELEKKIENIKVSNQE